MEIQPPPRSLNILLVAVNARYIHSNLGIYSLKAYAMEQQRRENIQAALPDACHAEISLAEYTINHSRAAILAGIFEKNPDVVGFSCYIWNMEYIKSLLLDLPKILAHTQIWLGGPEASYCAEELLIKFPGVSGVMVGEGEISFSMLVHQLRANAAARRPQDSSLSQIPGIVYRDSYGTIRENPPAPPLDMNTIPFVYTQPWMAQEALSHRILYYESSRGCPFSCSYCLSSLDKRVRFRDLKLVFGELQFFLDQKAEQVKFVDRTFNCKKSHTTAIWTYLLTHDNGVTNFHFELSADLLDEEELELLGKMRPGLVQLEIGVQTTNPKTIAEIHRTMDLDRLERAVGRIREGRNIHQHLDLIAGLPYEDRESFRQSFDRVFSMRPDQLQLGFLKVLKGSFMEANKARYGLRFTSDVPYEVLATKWLDYADILHFKRVEEMVEIYYNSGQFQQTMIRFERLFSRPVEMFEALAGWYAQRRLEDIGHSRQARYEIFFDYIRNHFPAETEAFRESLTMDIYLRENAKTRPAFARDQKAYRKEIRSFYEKEEKERHYLPDYQEYDSRQLSRMTHLEVLENGDAMLFDYANRDPLSYNARVVVIGRESFRLPVGAERSK